MTDTEYLKQMIALNEELERIASNVPLDVELWHNALDEMHRVNNRWYHSRRRRSWIIDFVIISVIVFILYLVYMLLTELKI